MAISHEMMRAMQIYYDILNIVFAIKTNITRHKNIAHHVANVVLFQTWYTNFNEHRVYLMVGLRNSC